ncbi:glycosyltransferase family 2 protein [Flavobacterium sp. ZB4P23]|uniref:glycosyltransferase family A protein n=1 Tax=unclassified Flavobacterium TaxID=196869 RepID=UPI000F8489B5|nr:MULTISPECIES: glycosyltransferase family 2 protein [unclassified Flavobacterium]RTY83274.1 glycosyltransferase family 2 protein [Flavobacterium sp. ZB4P23]RTY93149.1 glycosyltransferase family 2 protein [Flavobacterium sp. RSP46]
MLAIIIPYYKFTYFEETLKSLSNQTDKRFKVYIGDDASPENPLVLLSGYKDKFDFTYHRFEKKLGGISLTEQWERCIALSKNEEWLMILGDDDYLENTVVASWHENYNIFYKKAEVVRFASKIVVQENNKISDKFEHPIWEKATDAYLRKFNHLTRSSLSEYVFSKKTYNKYHFYNYPVAWNSDDQAWLDFSDNKSIFTINECVVYIRLSSSNISGKTDNFWLKNNSQILFYKKLIKEKLNYYEHSQRLLFLRRYENDILKTRKLTSADWFFLFVYYVKWFGYEDFKKILKRFLNTVLKRDEL